MHRGGKEAVREHTHPNSDLRRISRRRLWWALAINLAFLVVEVIGGLATGSLALLADAGHMLTDVLALGLAVFVAYLATRPPTPERTFGLLGAEVVGAFLNGATLVVIVGFVFWEAARRIFAPTPVQGLGVLVVAFAGLLANIGSAWVLAGSRKDSVNIEGAFLHMLADTLGSVGALLAGTVILLTGWTLIDPLASCVIGLLILWSSVGLLRQTLRILIYATPPDTDYHAIKAAIEANEHVAEVYDLHIWAVTSGFPVLTAHVRLRSDCCDTRHWQRCLRQIQNMIRNRFDIVHATLQLEPEGYQKDHRDF
jgi:cobalt-zinc-cadmium efflux system protein